MTSDYSLEGHDYSHDLLENVHGRYVFKSKNHPRPLRFIVLPFINPMMDSINLIALLFKAIISGRSDASKNAKDSLQMGDVKDREVWCVLATQQQASTPLNMQPKESK